MNKQFLFDTHPRFYKPGNLSLSDIKLTGIRKEHNHIILEHNVTVLIPTPVIEAMLLIYIDLGTLGPPFVSYSLLPAEQIRSKYSY